MFNCFWCNNKFPNTGRTLDHLKPKCLGGGDEPDNVVNSCKACNFSRGLVCGHHGFVKAMERDYARWPEISLHRQRMVHRAVRRYRKKRYQEAIANQRHWVEKERELIGTSYSDAMRLEVKEPPPLGSPPLLVLDHFLLKPASREANKLASYCPNCGDGVLAVIRNSVTLVIEEFDMCLKCGQRVRYRDVAVMRAQDWAK